MTAHQEAHDNFTQYIKQCIQLGKWGAAFDYTLEHERAGIITKQESEEWLRTFMPHLDASILADAEAAGVIA